MPKLVYSSFVKESVWFAWAKMLTNIDATGFVLVDKTHSTDIG